MAMARPEILGGVWDKACIAFIWRILFCGLAVFVDPAYMAGCPPQIDLLPIGKMMTDLTLRDSKAP
jgi:hypothetical protein